MRHIIGIDLGGSSVKGVLATSKGAILRRNRQDFDADQPMTWADTVHRLVDELSQTTSTLLPASGSDNLTPELCVGVSAPGLAANDGRSIACMPGRLQGLEGMDWAAFLQCASAVPVMNDAHAALMGEAWLGAARGFNSVIMLTLGTGVGGAAIVDGHLLRGRSGKAGHLGHTCLDIDGPADVCHVPGSLEMAMGNCTIEARSQGRFQSTHDLLKAHADGDGFATKVWLRSVKSLACAIATFTNILDPEAVVIGGGIANAGPLLFEPLREMLGPLEWRCGAEPVPLIPAQLGEYAGAIGAARKALSDTLRIQ